MTVTDESPPGLDLHRLSAHLRGNLADPPKAALRAELFAGGKSNLTYAVTDGYREWVVRRAPLGHVLATAHDVAREYHVMSALAATRIPVPRTFLLCTDPDVVGAPFCVMERVSGVAYRTAAELAGLGAARTKSIVLALVDQLAALHAVDPLAAGLANFGRPAGFLARQLERWRRQFESSRTGDRPGAQELHAGLDAARPADARPAIVHGDYRLDNVLFGADDDRIRAILDWEMSTIGDPLTDVALLVSRNRDTAGDVDSRFFDATSAAGFPGTSEMVERYASRSGRDVSGLAWYLALAHYKRAAILEGIHYRYLQHQTVGPDFERVGSMVEPTIQAGLRALAEMR
jgi:aminoglycoside phosphotransferase (APT) family kinase protein